MNSVIVNPIFLFWSAKCNKQHIGFRGANRALCFLQSLFAFLKSNGRAVRRYAQRRPALFQGIRSQVRRVRASSQQEYAKSMLSSQPAKRLKHINASHTLAQRASRETRGQQKRISVRHNQVSMVIDFA